MRKFTLLKLNLVVMFLLATAFNPSILNGADIITLSPTDDSFARSDNPTTVYDQHGDSVELNIRERIGGVSTRYSYLKFSIPAIPSNQYIATAVLTCYAYNNTSGTTQDIEVLLSGNGWDENTMNYNNRPAFNEGAGVLTFTFPVTAGFLNMDVTSLVDSISDAPVTLSARHKVIPNEQNLKFASRENATTTNRPVLTLTIQNKVYALTVNGGTGSGDYEESTVVPITANDPAVGYVFDKWTGDNQYLADSTALSTTVTMPAEAISVTATYKEAEKYTLTVTNGTGSGEYLSGEEVIITANDPAVGYVFDKWTGDNQYLADSTALSTTVTMPAEAISVTATYKEVEKYTLTVTNGTGSGEYLSGEEVIITANDPAVGYEFDKWTGDNQYLADSTALSTTVTMPAEAISVTATYKEVIDNINKNSQEATVKYYISESGKLRISSPKLINEMAVISITGKTILRKKIGATSYECSLSSLNAGCYLLKLVDNNGQQSVHKFIKR